MNLSGATSSCRGNTGCIPADLPQAERLRYGYCSTDGLDESRETLIAGGGWSQAGVFNEQTICHYVLPSDDPEAGEDRIDFVLAMTCVSLEDVANLKKQDQSENHTTTSE